ncbi:hypothetical protein ZWY2020_004577 [Hordeum vulgare]|nr:hypothetical protein ZWY2020_004577 [Hordeum vulgare]
MPCQKDAGPPKPSFSSSSARFDRILSGLAGGVLADTEPDKLGAWPEKGDGSSERGRRKMIWLGWTADDASQPSSIQERH